MTFDKPILKRGCCGTSLRGSTILAGYICLVIGILRTLLFIGMFSYLMNYNLSAVTQQELSKLSTLSPEEEDLLKSLVSADGIIDAVEYFLSSVCCCILTLLMIRGIHQGSPLWIIPWLTWLISDMISLTSYTLKLTLAKKDAITLVSIGISCVISTLISYFIMIGYSHFQELLQSRSNRCLRSDGGTVIDV